MVEGQQTGRKDEKIKNESGFLSEQDLSQSNFKEQMIWDRGNGNESIAANVSARLTVYPTQRLFTGRDERE